MSHSFERTQPPPPERTRLIQSEISQRVPTAAAAEDNSARLQTSEPKIILIFFIQSQFWQGEINKTSESECLYMWTFKCLLPLGGQRREYYYYVFKN